MKKLLFFIIILFFSSVPVLAADVTTYYFGTGGVASGNVTAPSDIGDNKVMRGHGGGKNAQDSNVTIEDDDNVTTPGKITATKGFVCGANANPGYTALDSDCPGTDKDVGGTYWHYRDGADGAENADYSVKITQGGVENTVIITFDESDDRWEIPAGKHFATTGDIMGAVNISVKSGNYTVGTDDAYESYGTLFVDSDNDTEIFTLPSAVAGMSACFVNGQGVSSAMDLRAGAGDYIVLDGTRTAAAEDITSAGALGDKCCVVAIDATDWHVMGKTGTWGIP